ncbi:hypothetical protein D3C76_126420 [compost metagenome]
MTDVSPKLNGALLAEKSYYGYYLLGKTVAEIEILSFSGGESFGNQAKIIIKNNQSISTGKDYPTLELALDAIVQLLEKEIKDDPFVLNAIKVY